MRQTNKFSKSIGVGLASLTGSSNRTYYVLQYRTATQGKRVGANQKVMVDYAEIGRDPNCAIRFGEEATTVSRKHAAIIREKDGHVIRQLSKTNQTIVNGRPVAKEWYLKHGDEIELANGGPKLAFLVPDNPSVGSIPITERLSLFRQQALRPYRQGMYAMAGVFLLVVGVLGFMQYQNNQTIQALTLNQGALEEANQISSARADSLEQANAQNLEVQAQLAGNMENLEASMARERRKMQQRLETQRAAMEAQIAASLAAQESSGVPSMDNLYKDVFYIEIRKITLTAPNGETKEVELGISGTGFLLEDGRFVTARHVVEPWYFVSGEEDPMLSFNIAASNGIKVEADILAFSPDGRQLKINSDNFSVDRSGDVNRSVVTESGEELRVTIADSGSADWAHARARGETGSLKSAGRYSNELPAQTELHVLGYPLGTGANSNTDIRPVYSNSSVGRSGLDDGAIITTGRNIDHGNSGGPAFVYKDGSYQVVGIISAGRGETLGIIVPIANIR